MPKFIIAVTQTVYNEYEIDADIGEAASSIAIDRFCEEKQLDIDTYAEVLSVDGEPVKNVEDQ